MHTGLAARQLASQEREAPTDIAYKQALTLNALNSPAMQQVTLKLHQQELALKQQHQNLLERGDTREAALVGMKLRQLQQHIGAVDALSGTTFNLGGQAIRGSELAAVDPGFFSTAYGANARLQGAGDKNAATASSISTLQNSILVPWADPSDMQKNPVTGQLELLYTKNTVAKIRNAANTDGHPQQAEARIALDQLKQLDEQRATMVSEGVKSLGGSRSSAPVSGERGEEGVKMAPPGSKYRGVYKGPGPYRGKPIYSLPDGRAWIDGHIEEFIQR